MSVNLSPEIERFIEQEVASGSYASREELIVAAVELLRQRQADLARLRAEIEGGKRGEGILASQQVFTYCASGTIPPRVQNSTSRADDQFSSSLTESWRGSPFEKGRLYRVIAPAPGWNGLLVVGELLTYERSTWSHYDGLSVFIFRSQSGGERTWVLRDDEPVESWRTVFELTVR